MNKKLIFSCLIALLALTSSPSISHADMVEFVLVNNSVFDFNGPTGTFNEPSGLSATFTTSVAGGNTGDFNSTSSGFGINAGGSDDETAQLDGVNGNESFTISFSGPVSATLTQVDIGDFGVNDAGTINIGGNQTAIDSGTDTVIPAHTELVGNTLTIAFTAGNPADTTGLGFSVDSLTFHVKAVPEPSSLALLSLASLGLLRRRRR